MFFHLFFFFLHNLDECTRMRKNHRRRLKQHTYLQCRAPSKLQKKKKKSDGIYIIPQN